MKFTPINSRREAVFDALQQCRSRTLDLFSGIDSETLSCQAHADFSPVGWHLGHIAYTEAYWILERCAGLPPKFPQYHQLFDADGLPKSERQHLPPLEEIRDYVDAVRTEILTYLETAPLEKQERLWQWLIQHESQHSETITLILQLQRASAAELYHPTTNKQSSPLSTEMVKIPAGEFYMGSNEGAQDNERPAHRIHLDTYWIDRYPVTCEQYREFIAAGGYQNRRWWSEEGWQWLQSHPVAQPLYWWNSPDWDQHPVCGVSWYEAQAYARFVGKRLPTEAEWEKAASWDKAAGCKHSYPWGEVPPSAKTCNHDTLVGHTTPANAYPAGQSAYGCYDMLGNVWEWTASWFDGYEGFQRYPYRGYSQVYFDNQHRVLRGGSWATRPWALRASWRNWYYPSVRQILAGFRCVSE